MLKHKNNLLPRGQTVQDVDEAKIVNAELRPGQFSIHDLKRYTVVVLIKQINIELVMLYVTAHPI